MSSSRLSAVPAGSFNSPSSVDHYAIAVHLLISKCEVQAVELSAATMHAAGTRIMQGDGQCSAQWSCQAMTAAMIPCMLTKLSAGESKRCMRLMQSRARISTGYAGGVRPSMQHAIICRHARSKRSCLCWLGWSPTHWTLTPLHWTHCQAHWLPAESLRAGTMLLERSGLRENVGSLLKLVRRSRQSDSSSCSTSYSLAGLTITSLSRLACVHTAVIRPSADDRLGHRHLTWCWSLAQTQRPDRLLMVSGLDTEFRHLGGSARLRAGGLCMEACIPHNAGLSALMLLSS